MCGWVHRGRASDVKGIPRRAGCGNALCDGCWRPSLLAAAAAALLLPLLPPTPLHHTFRFTSPPTSLPALPLPASPLTPILRPAAEIIKRRIVGLHQDTAISSVELKDHWEPKEEGLDPIETTRHVSVITITLSKVGTCGVGWRVAGGGGGGRASHLWLPPRRWV